MNPAGQGTKAAAHYRLEVPAGGQVELRLRLSDKGPLELGAHGPFDQFDETFALRLQEADEFYAGIIPSHLSDDARHVMRQAFGGLLWSKQFYHYVVKDWLEGDPAEPRPPESRLTGRNHAWTQLYNADVISMPDKWEYPWYAAWDLAFHCIALALVDPEFAKEQLTLLLREWYMHPSGQLPAYEWALGDVNPPVHAWAVWRVYKIEKKRGRADRRFLERCFHKLLLNFTWWVNRKDTSGNNVFEGGFLGLDNIGVFDRSKPLPTGGFLEQSDGTSWMAMYSTNLLAIALELARVNPTYEDVASKFWEHFLLHRQRDEQGRRPWHRSVGRAGRLLLRRAAPAGRLARADSRQVDGRVDSAVRRRDARAGDHSDSAGLLEAARLVHRQPAGPDRTCRVDVGPPGMASAGCCRWWTAISCAAFSRPC